MDPSTNKRKGSEELPEPKRSKSSRRKRNGKRSRNKRPKPRQRKAILEALNENGSIDMELLKGICRGCLERLREKHAKGKCNFRPAHIFYAEVDEKIEIEFCDLWIKPTLNDCLLSELMWMAPEMLKKNSKPTADSDVFTLGLIIYFMLTKRESPLDINTTFLNCEFHHKVKIDLKLLEALEKDTDIILFIDLIKRMIKEVPDQREICENLIEHAALKSNEGRLEIVQLMADKCFSGDKCKNEYLGKIIDKKEVHMEGFLGEDSDEWKEFLAETSKLPEHPDIKTCCSLLKIFQKSGRFYDFEFEKNCLKYLKLIMALLPNFFPHVYNIYREELPKVKDGAFKEIFKHFNDVENSLGTGSYGTIVYKGKFGQREIAIKRVMKIASKEVEREISIIMKIDRHPNILKYFAKEEDENFIYIGTELCEGNLATFVQDKTHNIRQKMPTKTILQQSAEGLKHLHQLNIIHRDVKPENILIFNDNGTYSVKLADFGISKPLNAKTTLSTVNVNIPGTLAWIAPEVGEKGHAKSSDVFSLGCVFYFVILDGLILRQDLSMSYFGVEKKLEEKHQKIDQRNNDQFMQMDLLIRILKVKPELRPTVEKVMHHPLFWENKRCLEFILEIRKKFDILDPKFIRKIKNEHHKVLREAPIVQQLKAAIDSDKSVIHNSWKAKIDPTLAEEFTGDYDKESVSDLLKAIRNKWMHIMELKDAVKDLFGNGTESEYLNYFTSKFPRLLIHCYNAVEKEATELLEEYFPLNELSETPSAAIGTLGPEFEGSKLILNCEDNTTFPETKVDFVSIKIKNISRLFIEENKSFTNFLQRNASNITQLEFLRGSLKFDSVNKILQKLPNLKEIKFDEIEYETPKTCHTIQQATCKSLVKLEIKNVKSSKLLEALFQAFQECQSMQKLTVDRTKLTLEEILQKYPGLDELKIMVDDNYPSSYQLEANLIHQLKVLKIELVTYDEKVQENLITSIKRQNNLQQFNFISENIFSFCSPPHLWFKQLAAHIWGLKFLTSLEIKDEELLEEVEAFVANCQGASTHLEEFSCELRYLKSLPSSFLGHFTNLRQLDIDCYKAEDKKVEDLLSFMNRAQLTSIKLWYLPPASFQSLLKWQIHSLQVLVIYIYNWTEEKVPAFDILQEFLPRHPNITQFEIGFERDWDEPMSLKLVPMIVETLTKLERLEVEKYSEITAENINQIAALKMLKWKINDFKSETFYKTIKYIPKL